MTSYAKNPQCQRREEQLALLFGRASFRTWLDTERQRIAEVNEEAEDYSVLLEKLSPILEYFGACLEPRAMAMRLWCFLKLARPTFVSDETVESASQRFGVNRYVIMKLMDDLRLELPALVAGSQRIEARTRKAMKRQANREAFLRCVGGERDDGPEVALAKAQQEREAVARASLSQDSRGCLWDAQKFLVDAFGRPRVDRIGRYIPRGLGRRRTKVVVSIDRAA